MRKNLWHKSLPGCILLLLATASRAQLPFAYRTPVTQVPASKFYAINLSPGLLASCKTADLSDLRLTDSAGAVVPYLLRVNGTTNPSTKLSVYPILSNVRKDSSSELTIRNESPGAIRSLSLIIKNASAYRTGLLSGSDDRDHWFVIDEYVAIDPVVSASGDQFIQTLEFPLSNYRFFKLTLFDKGLLPLNIVQAGVSQSAPQAGKYLSLPVSRIRQLDSADQYTYLTVRFGQAYKIDQLRLRISRPALYKRTYSFDVRKPVLQSYGEGGELRPGTDSILLSVKASELLIRIWNGDNPPLKIDSVLAYQTERQMVAQLDKDKQYFVLTGNASAGRPQYDLQFFSDSLSGGLTGIQVGSVLKNPLPAGQAVSPPSRYGKPVMWAAIGTVLLLLLWLTFRMSKEIGQKQPPE